MSNCRCTLSVVCRRRVTFMAGIATETRVKGDLLLTDLNSCNKHSVRTNHVFRGISLALDIRLVDIGE